MNTGRPMMTWGRGPRTEWWAAIAGVLALGAAVAVVILAIALGVGGWL